MKKYIIYLVLLGAIEISLALYLTFFREHFWNAIQAKDVSTFLSQLGVFTGVALCICFVSGMSGYLVSLTAIKWREKLNSQAFINSEQTDIMNITSSKIENLNQRIQADCMDYPTLMLTLGFGLVKALAYITVFVVSLVVSFSWVYLTILFAYTILGTLVTKYIAKPLIALNYKQQQVEATYRNYLSPDNFSECVRLMLGLARKQKHLTYFQQFYGQIGVVIPLIIIAPAYFTTGMTIGMLMRFNSTAGTILDNMGWGISSFGEINRLLSCRKRLLEAKIL